MKEKAIILLLCVNVALLLALMFGTGVEKANAQVAGGAANYLVVTGTIGQNTDAIYVLDVARQRLLAWRYDHGGKKFRLFRGRSPRRGI